jgi:outer membrane protein TolC
MSFAAILILAGCTFHPDGESEERKISLASGRNFEKANVLQLPADPTPDDLVRRALTSNRGLQQQYWEWRSAIEQIPQDGTQATNLALFAGMGITNGSTSLDASTLGLGNDPMADIVLPPKLSTAAKRALENARAAGHRFRKSQFELRSKVLATYADYALTSELIRLQDSNTQLLEMSLVSVQAKTQTGTGSEQEMLQMQNDLDLSRNDSANFRSQLPAEVAALNSLLDREPDAAIPVPHDLPAARRLVQSGAEQIQLAATRNPELLALSHESTARQHSIGLAKLQYLPDISLSANSNLTGVTQSLAGMVTVPILRYQAINAAVEQAEDNLKASEAMRLQAGNDLASVVVMDSTFIGDADRQILLFQSSVLPRAHSIVAISRSSYETGQSSYLQLVEGEKSVIAIDRLIANLRVSREKRVLELEAIIARPISETATGNQ